MTADLKSILKKSGQSLLEKQGTVKVIAALSVSEPDEACLRRLQSLGLSIDRTVENKIIGTIAAEKLSELRTDSDVQEVEVSVQLEPHAKSTPKKSSGW